MTVTAQVAGRVKAIHPPFEEGAFFAKGDVLLEIDPVDLQVALISAQAQVASAQLNLEKEETAGAVVYKIAINSKAHPADVLASLTLGTVKNLTIT